MCANVRDGVVLTFVIQTQQTRDHSGVGLDEIPWVHELASVPHIEPTTGKHRRLFEREDLRIRKYAAADRSVSDVNEGRGHDLALTHSSSMLCLPSTTNLKPVKKRWSDKTGRHCKLTAVNASIYVAFT